MTKSTDLAIGEHTHTSAVTGCCPKYNPQQPTAYQLRRPFPSRQAPNFFGRHAVGAGREPGKVAALITIGHDVDPNRANPQNVFKAPGACHTGHRCGPLDIIGLGATLQRMLIGV